MKGRIYTTDRLRNQYMYLKAELDGSYQIAYDGRVFIHFNNPYGGPGEQLLRFRVYDRLRNVVAGTDENGVVSPASCPPVPVMLGENWVSVNLASVTNYNEYYTLEVWDAHGGREYMRFVCKGAMPHIALDASWGHRAELPHPDSVEYCYYPQPQSRHTDAYTYRYGFSGQERDDGIYGPRKMYGYEFREYDTRLGRWWGVDPLAGKYPSQSPYSYCGGSPMVMVDPSGGFGVSVHKKILKNAMYQAGMQNSFKDLAKSDLNLGIGIYSDYVGFSSDFHFDGKADFIAVQNSWNVLNKNIQYTIKQIGNCNMALGMYDIVKFGRLLHTVQDFYAHSNYIDLYVEYYKSNHNGEVPLSVPIYDDGKKDSEFYAILQNKLRTGDFNPFDNEYTNPQGKRAQSPTSHNKMNKDDVNTFLGRYAEATATEHTRMILLQLNENLEEK